MSRLTEKLYAWAPVALQHVLVSIYGWHWRRLRLGGHFRAEVEAFRRREWFSAEQWQTYTGEQLTALLLHAFNRVPYYHHQWGAAGFDAGRLAHLTPADLPCLPVLPKDVARDRPLELLESGRPARRAVVLHTSGSTGAPVPVYWLPHELQRSLAIREARCLHFAGVSFSLPRATFGGRLVVPDPDSPGPYYRYNWFERQVYLSAFHLRPDTAPGYLAALQHHGVQWMTGYSHSIYELARFALEQNLPAPSLKAVITTSEPVTPLMRQTIEQAFNTRVFEEYGAVENAFLVCECEHHRKHINPDAGIIEIVDEHFSPVPAGTEGEVLVTGFIRWHQPLIRYRIGDRAVLDDQPCPCGRAMPVLREVSGRIEDTVYAPDGRRMVRFHGLFVEQPHVLEGQVVQERLDLLRIRVVPRPGFNEADRAGLIRRVHQRLGQQVQVEVELVDQLERTPSGKVQAVISHLDPADIARPEHPDG